MKNCLVKILFVVIGVILGTEIVKKINRKKVLEKNNNIEKFKMYYAVINQWLILKEQGQNLLKYFEDAKYKVIVIYGIKGMGMQLYDELSKSSIHIAYFIDEECGQFNREVEIVNLQKIRKKKSFTRVDAVVVTKIYAYDEIKRNLLKLFDCPIVSLEDIIYEYV